MNGEHKDGSGEHWSSPETWEMIKQEILMNLQIRGRLFLEVQAAITICRTGLTGGPL